MKKIIFIAAMATFGTMLNAQIKVISTGQVGVNNSNPVRSFHVVGNSVFSKKDSAITSAPLIQGHNIYSTSTARYPDYTWYGDSTTGIFHDAVKNIGLSINGVEKLRIGDATLGTILTIKGTTYSSLFDNGTNQDVFLRPGTSSGNIFMDYGKVLIGTTTPCTTSLLFQAGPTNSSAAYSTCVGSDVWINAYQLNPLNSNEYIGYLDVRNKVANSNIGLFIRTQHGDTIYYGAYVEPNGNWNLPLARGAGATDDNATAYHCKLYVAGNIYCTGQYLPSDMSLKKNVKNISKVTDKIKQLQAISYNVSLPVSKDSSSQTQLSKPDYENDTHFGFDGNVIKQLFPEIIKTGKNGLIAVDYISIIPLLVEAFKELKSHNDSLENVVSQLNMNYQSCCNKTKDLKVANTTDAISNTAEQSTILYQNIPNPFSQNTEIKFSIPATVNKAAIYIYDLQGKQVKRIDLSARGESSIIIQGAELTAGMYNYALITDGVLIDTKKMVLTD